MPTDTERLDFLQKRMIDSILLPVNGREGEICVWPGTFKYAVLPHWYGDEARPDIRQVLDEAIAAADISHIPISDAANIRGPLREAVV